MACPINKMDTLFRKGRMKKSGPFLEKYISFRSFPEKYGIFPGKTHAAIVAGEHKIVTALLTLLLQNANLSFLEPSWVGSQQHLPGPLSAHSADSGEALAPV